VAAREEVGYFIVPFSDTAIVLESSTVGLNIDARLNNFRGPRMDVPLALTSTPPLVEGLFGTAYAAGVLGPEFPLLDGRLVYEDDGTEPVVSPLEERDKLARVLAPELLSPEDLLDQADGVRESCGRSYSVESRFISGG
jgi:hypothetical protein